MKSLASLARERGPGALLAAALLALAPAAHGQAAGPDRAVLDACGPGDEALNRAALEVARRRLKGQRVSAPEELSALLREAGSTAAWPRSLVLRGQPVDRSVAAAAARDFAKKIPARLPLRCGVASVSDDQGAEVLAVLAAPVAARVAPFAPKIRVGAWFTVDARLLVPASGARVVVLGPSGLPRTIPTSFHKGRVQGRFAVDRPGRWLAQVVADLDGGPLPVAELEVRGGEPAGDAAPGPQAPGEGATGPSDEAALLAMINEARKSEGLGPLERDEALAKLALEHASAMARKQLVAHDVGGGDPEQRAAHLQPRALGENVAHALSLPQAHRALWSSPSHRQNLLTARFRKAGVAVVREGDSLWVTELFTDP